MICIVWIILNEVKYIQLILAQYSNQFDLLVT